MPTRKFIRRDGNVKVILYLQPERRAADSGKECFSGRVEIQTDQNNGIFWLFDDLREPWRGSIRETVDSAARAAVAFGSNYSTGNRGDDLPDWAPSAEFADALDWLCAFMEEES